MDALESFHICVYIQGTMSKRTVLECGNYVTSCKSTNMEQKHTEWASACALYGISAAHNMLNTKKKR